MKRSGMAGKPTRRIFVVLFAVALVWQALAGFFVPVLAQSKDQADRINDYWNNLDKKFPNLNKTYQVGDIQKPGAVQNAGDVKAPAGNWQETKPIAPVGARAITAKTEPCHQRLIIGADALFDFDKSTLTQDALITLKAMVPMIAKMGAHPIRVEGHTDSKGSDEYNQALSERRAERVKNWLVENRVAPATAFTYCGFGEKKPVAANEKADGSDYPEGRAHNRRVEIVIDTCTNLAATQTEAAGEAAAPAQPAADGQTGGQASGQTSDQGNQRKGEGTFDIN